jgi:hypothetical protein
MKQTRGAIVLVYTCRGIERKEYRGNAREREKEISKEMVNKEVWRESEKVKRERRWKDRRNEEL